MPAQNNNPTIPTNRQQQQQHQSNTGDNRITKSPFFRPSITSSSTAAQAQSINLKQQQQPQYVVIQEATPRGKHVYSRNIAAVGGGSHKNNTSTSSTTNSSVVKEQKSTIFGATGNLVNAILGCGIVGVPYAIKQSGFVAGLLLIVVASFITDKSLRLLINTAKHVHVGTYETALEAVFGLSGFRFTAINMFIVAYGGMISYLMIVKDTFSSVAGIDPSNTPVRRSILFVISVTIILPLSCQRDMADLAFTSRLSVIIDTLLVGIIMYTAPSITDTQEFATINDNDATQPTFWNSLIELVCTDIINTDTIFVGLGVLSFAFVCQHSAFIIAGSLDKPTVQRWAKVTWSALTICSILAMFCGVYGYLGYRDNTAGNILMNLNPTSKLTVVAKLSLGISMLFVYPLDSMVVRHVAIVLLFQGRAAHEGNDDATILNRRDRRVLLTVALYLSAVIPAALFENLGSVLAITGAIGGSCLSYIGPGILYLGVHGDEFIELATTTFWGTTNDTIGTSTTNQREENKPPAIESLRAVESTPLVSKKEENKPESEPPKNELSLLQRSIRTIGWYVSGMPLWCWIAQRGNKGLQTHIHDMTMKSPHPIRIGDVVYRRVLADLQQQAKRPPKDRRNELDDDNDNDDEEDPPSSAPIIRQGSFARNLGNNNNRNAMVLSPYITNEGGRQILHNAKLLDTSNKVMSGNNINQMIGKNLLDQQQQQKAKASKGVSAGVDASTIAIDQFEPDPQEATPQWYDFIVAIFLIVFGIIAMIAGIFSLFASGS